VNRVLGGAVGRIGVALTVTASRMVANQPAAR
jgi:hypothetical protein